jgi:hypothetical protein
VRKTDLSFASNVQLSGIWHDYSSSVSIAVGYELGRGLILSGAEIILVSTTGTLVHGTIKLGVLDSFPSSKLLKPVQQRTGIRNALPLVPCSPATCHADS